ncbi:SMP-30/gluconolactonase/LRE family protein [Larkinella humicola]|uniref:SMP-30/gluconolactonase/LRE family protein n=1 Tax=Larkinella humicola TaxID=2607654 RepID=A0A5N1JN25_9BACT|nr:SMP-30/gluconolactonase/LRE family protein [Larkinella humicola]KAA9355323.1 SMP-30/gluconolactonase/LRE family protein [Larkinella humicola]
MPFKKISLVVAALTGAGLLLISAMPNTAEELFKSTVFTPVNGFTSGVEGPAVDKSGTVYAVNFGKQGTIGQVTSTGDASVFIELPEGSIGNGIRFNKKGDMFIADYPKHNILKVAAGTKNLSVFAHEPRMNQPNDIAIDGKDRLYASDPSWKNNTGNLWRIDTDGKVTLLEENMGTTNGVEVSPDDKHLYVNESNQRKVWIYDLSADGKISNKRLLIEFPDFGMDGMRCDADGNLYLTRFGKGTIAKVAPSGKVIQEITLVGKRPTNICFGGKDGRTAYVTLQDQGNLESFRVDKPGREWAMRKK